VLVCPSQNKLNALDRLWVGLGQVWVELTKPLPDPIRDVAPFGVDEFQLAPQGKTRPGRPWCGVSFFEKNFLAKQRQC